MAPKVKGQGKSAGTQKVEVEARAQIRESWKINANADRKPAKGEG